MCTQKVIQWYQPFVPSSDQPALGGDAGRWGWEGQDVHTENVMHTHL